MLQRAVHLSRSVANPAGQAEQLSNLGNAWFFRGKYADAKGAYDSALQLTTQHADEDSAPRQRRLVMVNQATLHQRLGRFDEALSLYKQVQGLRPALRPQEQAQILVNEGALYRRLGDPIKALETYGLARALFQEDRHLDGELGVLKNQRDSAGARPGPPARGRAGVFGSGDDRRGSREST